MDVTDEAIIDSPPMAVYNALLNEIKGVTHWWMPYLEFKLRGDTPAVCEGAIFDLTIYPTSRITSFKVSAKVTKIVEAKSIELEMTGALVGTEYYTFEPTDGKTNLQIRLNVRTNRLFFSLVSPFVDIGKKHSDNMQKGFKALNSYLSKK